MSWHRTRDRTLSDPKMVPIGPRMPMVRRDVTRSRSHQTMASPSVTRIDSIVAMLPPLSTRMGERTRPRRGTIAAASCGLTGVC